MINIMYMINWTFNVKTFDAHICTLSHTYMYFCLIVFLSVIFDSVIFDLNEYSIIEIIEVWAHTATIDPVKENNFHFKQWEPYVYFFGEWCLICETWLILRLISNSWNWKNASLCCTCICPCITLNFARALMLMYHLTVLVARFRRKKWYKI